MVSHPDSRENDPSLAKLKLRSELSFSLHRSGGQPYVLVRDELRSQYFRLGTDEWKICRLLDGNATLRQVASTATELVESNTSTLAEVLRLGHWLVQNQLAECVSGGAFAHRDPAASSHNRDLWQEPIGTAAQMAKWNPLFLKVTLPDPQPALRFLYPAVAGIFSKFFFPVWLLLCLLGGYHICAQWERFSTSAELVISNENWIYLILAWLFLKLLHELGHAVACMRYGGDVPRCGLMFVVFSPIAWVDVTSAWHFRSKWQRILVSTAGMYIELLVAAVAAITWSGTADSVAATILHSVVVSASVSTLVFNLNFLMRFDAYYILADLLDVQNLYAMGQRTVSQLSSHYFLGFPKAPTRYSRIGQLLLTAYGLACLVWRIIFCVGILAIASHLFHGLGVLLALFSGLIWFGLPTARFAAMMWRGPKSEPRHRRRFAVVCGLCAAGLAICLAMPWPGRTRAYGVVEFSPLQTVRVDSPGFVERVEVVAGQAVERGDVLIQLENRMLSNELADIDLRIKVEETARRVAHREGEMAEYQTLGDKLVSLRDQRRQLAEKVEALTVRAPIAGDVIAGDAFAGDVDSLTGRYLESGNELLSVGSTGEKEARISIRQRDASAFLQQTAPVAIRVKGRKLHDPGGRFERLIPQATRRVIRAPLAASVGGPLPVQQNPDGENQDDVLLVEPHFEGIVVLSQPLSDELRSGELCLVQLQQSHERVYDRLWRLGQQFLDRKYER